MKVEHQEEGYPYIIGLLGNLVIILQLPFSFPVFLYNPNLPYINPLETLDQP